MDRLTRARIAVTVLIVGLAAAASLALSPSRLLAELASLSARPAYFGAALVALYLLRPLFAWPVSPLSALVGYVLGVAYGVPVALAGAVVTCVPPYLFARYAADREGREADVFDRLGRTGRRFVEVTGAARGVLAARLSPVPADPVSYAAGFAGVPPRAFVAGTLVGEIPWVILEVLAGASMRRLTVEGLTAGVHVLVASAAVAALVLAGPAYRHVRRDRPG